MAIRPIDIARALGVSATTLRTYEDMGLAPRARRTAAGYRVYTEEHAAYFACVREMLPAFSLSFLRRVLAKVQTGDAAGAFWLLNEAQAALWSDRQAARRFVEHIVEKKPPREGLRTIGQAAGETGLPATTIRYWERAGLIVPLRGAGNRYRLYDAGHIRRLLILHAVKLSVRTQREKHFLHEMEAAYRAFDPEDPQEAQRLAEAVRGRLDETLRAQMRAAAALEALCRQVESGRFAPFVKPKKEEQAMAKLRKMLGRVDGPETVALMRLMETQSKETLARWAVGYAEDHCLPLYEHACPGDARPRAAVKAARRYLDGEGTMSEAKAAQRAADAAAREAAAQPVAQAACRAVTTACAAVHTPTCALGFTFYGAAAAAYAQAGLQETPAVYDQLAAAVQRGMLAALQRAAVPDEPHPEDIDWNC